MNNFLLNFFAILLSEFVRVKLFSEISFLKPLYNLFNVILFLLCMFVYTIVSMYTESFLRFIILNASSIILYKSLFSIKIKDILYFICVIYIISEMIALPVEFLTKGLVYQSYEDYLFYKYIKLYVIFLHSVVLIILLNRDKFIKAIQIIYIYAMKNEIFFKRVIEVYCFITLFHVLLYKCSFSLAVIFYTIYLLAIIFHLLLVVVYYICKVNTEYVSGEKYRKLQNEYSLESKEYMRMRHNLLNDLLAVKTSKFNDSVIDMMVKKYKKNYQISDFLTTQESGINGIIDIKIENAKMMGVRIIYNKPINKVIELCKDVNYINLCEAVGIVIDNAIEAVMEMDEKIVYVDVDNTDGFHMKVINKFSNSVDIDSIFINNYSTKKRGSGLGLNYLYTLKKYGIETKINIIDNTFIICINA